MLRNAVSPAARAELDYLDGDNSLDRFRHVLAGANIQPRGPAVIKWIDTVTYFMEAAHRAS
jgi:hypothetical protein